MNPQDAVTNSYDVIQNKLAQLKVLSQELDSVRNELNFTIKALEEFIRKGSPDALI